MARRNREMAVLVASMNKREVYEYRVNHRFYARVNRKLHGAQIEVSLAGLIRANPQTQQGNIEDLGRVKRGQRRP